MLIHELTPDECREILQQANVARLGCALNGQPYIVPIHYYFDADALYSFATLGQKVEWMRANPKVCVEADHVADSYHWTTVVAFGLYQELSIDQGHDQALRRAHALFEQRPAWWKPATGKIGSVEHHVPVVYRICLSQMTGRRAARIQS
jgi:nitroimidazol reductase NimA-like FMN-containing flavoprotein (pyridoxamine 5'-phosphate oxidase superfamily)